MELIHGRTPDEVRVYDRFKTIVAVILALLLLLCWWRWGKSNTAAVAPAATVAMPAATPVPRATIPAVALVAVPKVGDMNFSVVDGKITITGSVPTAQAKADIIATAQKAYGAKNVVDAISIDAALAAPGYMTKLGDLFAGLKGAGNGAWLATASTVTLVGEVKNATTKTDRVDWASTFFKPLGLGVDDKLTIVAAPAFVLSNVQFASGSATLNASARNALNELVTTLKANGKAVQLSGHTDNVGLSVSNQVLSEKRAEACAEYLIAQGIAKAKVTSRGYGDTKPVGDNTTAEGRAKNRRMEADIR
jgi:OmpA-OmpF porin, OOP family